MGERVSIVVISDQLYSFPLVYRAICHFTGKILGPGGGHVRSKFETIPFPTSIFRFLSLRSSPFLPLSTSLSTFIYFLSPVSRGHECSPVPLAIAIRECFALSRAVFPYPRPAYTPIYLPVMDIIK